ncbi:iron compound permease protein of ABC transporter family [Klebsiella pneumoniae]|uniref:Iron compound permease protein of ABC transporter family n=1 Tax=Klebsiella pneumoniae TaxID=573 RepID=A0A377XC40_KLEPN|nr:iron compound permease protein of ABC transporter family [Klebsiella pneumoniae]
MHLGLGARWIAPQTVLQALLEYDPRNFEQRIIIDLRLVRLAAALLTGAAGRRRCASRCAEWRCQGLRRR